MTFKNIIYLGIGLALLFGIAWIMTGERKTTHPLSSWDDSWYAVTLQNGSVYFGHLRAVSQDTITLANTHYFEVYETAGAFGNIATSSSFQIERETTPQTVYNLIRRGSDDSNTTDHTLFINRSAVLYWERLDANSATVKNIEAAQQAASQ